MSSIVVNIGTRHTLVQLLNIIIGKNCLMSTTQTLPTKIALMKGGIGAGLMGGFALFSSFFAIDQMLDIPAGTFYKTIGVTMGVDETSSNRSGLYGSHGRCSIDRS